MNKFLLLLIIIILVFHWGCENEPKLSDTNTSSFNIFAAEGQVVPLDSIKAPRIYKTPTPVISPAFVVDRIKPQNNTLQTVTPKTYPIGKPQKRTPGIGSYLMPQKVKASPIIHEAILPEFVKLKDPVSKGNNPFSFLSHSKTQGLSHDDIVCFLEDHLGNMWIGSFGGGLMRFDGQNLAYYSKTLDGEIPEVLQIQQDTENNFWIATTRGLFKFDGFHTYYYDSSHGGLLHDSMQSLQIDQQGNLWMSYWEGGISMFDGIHFHHYGTKQGLSIEKGQILQADNQGNIWISDHIEGLFLFKEGSFYIYEIPGLSEENLILEISVDHDNNVWLSLLNLGVVKFNEKEFSFYTLDNGFPSGQIYKIMHDSRGRHWFGSWGKGIIRMNGDIFEIFNQTLGLASDFINDIYEDSAGTIWIAFYNGGMARYYGDVFTHYTIKKGFDQQIANITQTKDGKIWLAALEGGIISYDGDEFLQFSNSPKADDTAYMGGFVADSSGNLWLSINGKGIYRFDGTKFHHYPLEQLSEPLIIDGGMEDNRGNLWFLIAGQGILKYDGTHFSHYTTESGLPVNFINAVAEDKEGNIWFGTWGGGAFKLKESTITYYNKTHGLQSDYIYAIYPDSEGNIWLGTDGYGLALYNGERFIHFTSEDGLTDNYVFSITQDDDGNMIFGGRFGLNIMTYNSLVSATLQSLPNPQKFQNKNETTLFINHTYEDGFLGVGTNQGVILRAKDRIWIGTNDRLTSFYPQASFYDTIVPHVKISQIDLFNEQIDWKSLSINEKTPYILTNGVKLSNYSFDGLSPWYQLPENLQLAHNNNFITFQFAGTSISSAGKINYSFKLEGFDQNWQKPTPENKAHYGNLPPGDYILKVKAMNRMGIWSQEEHYPFVIMTPWFQTWWAWLLYVTIAVSVFMLFIKIRERALVFKNKILDNEVELAKKTIEIKQNIIANVSHELRTPLTGIIGLTDILAKTPLSDTQKEYLNTLKQSGNNLREIINQILDYSKIESGEITLKNVPFCVEELFTHAEKVFSSLQKKNTKVRIETFISADMPKLLYGDRGRINQIIQNLLYNAIKFTPEGSIRLEASVSEIMGAANDASSNEEVLIKISVKDTGIGISPEAIQKLFTPFSQIELKDTRDTDSTGLGLAISRKLTELLGGNIDVESKPGIGSHFWFTFKVQKASKRKPDIANHNSTHSLSPMRLLLVEDKKVNQMVIKLILESMGHKVALASDGKQALDVFKPGSFDAIFMDIQMPVMDGITATKELKANHQKIPPIIGLSANAFEGDREKYMSQGLDEYITKPVTEDGLNEILKKVHMNNV